MHVYPTIQRRAKEEKVDSTSYNTDDQASSCRQIPNLPLRFSNYLASKALVKMSVSCSFVSPCSSVTTFSSTRSLMK